MVGAGDSDAAAASGSSLGGKLDASHSRAGGISFGNLRRRTAGIGWRARAREAGRVRCSEGSAESARVTNGLSVAALRTPAEPPRARAPHLASLLTCI